MRALLLTTMLLTISTTLTNTASACAPIRLGYINQHRPPYYLGDGDTEPLRPGAAVELMRIMAAHAGCTITGVRLPLPRIRHALALGNIDAAPINPQDDDVKRFALPLDKNGKLDDSKSIRLVTVVYVRAADRVAASTDPLTYFKSHRLGLLHGAPYAQSLRSAGLQIDEGALDPTRNFEKIQRHHIDGFAVSLVEPEEMDAEVAARYGDSLVRLVKPLRSTDVWLATSRSYYAGNKAAVEAMWDWLATHGRVRYRQLIKQYEGN